MCKLVLSPPRAKPRGLPKDSWSKKSVFIRGFATFRCKSAPKTNFLRRSCQKVSLTVPSVRPSEEGGFVLLDVPTFDIRRLTLFLQRLVKKSSTTVTMVNRGFGDSPLRLGNMGTRNRAIHVPTFPLGQSRSL